VTTQRPAEGLSGQLLTTKLYVPPARLDLVQRPRLIDRLNSGLRRGHRLIVISAPAGFGKTTLLSEWVQHLKDTGRRPREYGRDPRARPPSIPHPFAVTWLALDNGDNEPSRFLAYLTVALQSVRQDVGQSALKAISSPGRPSAELILTKLIEELSDSADEPPGSPERRVILVLDDYHLIDAPPIHEALAFMLDRLPAGMHLVIATRADPPLPLAALRARGELTEIRLSDLRFTLDEAAAFLNRTMKLALPTDMIATLASRTEGWITGLQLAAVSIQGRDARHAGEFIEAFGGSDRHILDYLMEEVLRRQSPEVQTFLLRTSILSRLTASLCDAVLTGAREQERADASGERTSDWLPCYPDGAGEELVRSRSQEMLEHIAAGNLFIVPLDGERRWYRYHALFVDLLRQRLQHLHRSIVPELHRRASRWYEGQGLIAEAIQHALPAGDMDRAADLIEQVAEVTLMQSQIATFLGWIEALPDEYLGTRPSLSLLHAWALLMSGRPLEMVEDRLQSVMGGTDLAADRLAPLRAFIAYFRGQVAQAGDLSRQALDHLPQDDRLLRGSAAWSAAMTFVADGDTAAGSQALTEAAQVSLNRGNLMIAVWALCHLAELHIAQGRLRSARDVYQKAQALGTDDQRQPAPIAGMALMGLGKLAREWNHLEEASRLVMKGIELAEHWGALTTLEGYIALARIRQAQGDMLEAHAALEKARQVAREFDVTELDDLMVACHQARLWLAEGNLAAAIGWARGRGLDRGTVPDELTEERRPSLVDQFRQYEYLTFARILVSQGQSVDALALLQPLLTNMERMSWYGGVIKVKILMALAYASRGDLGPAVTLLEQALSLAEPENYIRAFIDEGLPMAKLLRQAATQGIARDYVRRLLTVFEREPVPEEKRPAPPSAGPAIDTPSPADPLSGRELEVLQLIAEGLPDREIANRMIISLHTVKTHNRNIYHKLGVRNRTQAIAMARNLGILPTS
jgi:LuxR family maltose regulon positive regulatory protein